MKEKVEKMDDEKLVSYLNKMSNDARSYIDTKLQPKWKKAQKYYFGEKMGNEVEGKSQVISRDFSDSVDWMMPSLMEIFASGRRAVQYQPTLDIDTKEAEHRTDYANHVFFSKNDGFQVMYDWFKDALMFNTGVVKHYWEEREETKIELYEGLTEEEYLLVLATEGVEQIEHTAYEDGTHDVRVSHTKDKSQIVVEGIKPESFLIDDDATCAKDARFIGEQTKVTISDLRAMGYKESVIQSIKGNMYDEHGTGELAYIRDNFNGVGLADFDEINGGEANQFVYLTEAYVRVDYDGDGITELRRVVWAGNTLLDNDAWDRIPYSTLTPNPIQHAFYGQSVFDNTADIQDVKTALLRNQLDNMYLTNNGRYAVVEGQVNLSDLANNKTGGVVREKMQGALRALEQPPLPQGAYDMLGYMDELKTNRTGVSARSQGLDDKVLNSHTGQGQVNKVMSVAEQRLKLVARIFAETGVTDLFSAIYELTVRYQNNIDSYFKDGKFVRVNPAEWDDKTTVQVVTGLGANDDDQKQAFLTRLFEVTQSVINGGGLDVLTNEEKIYNLLKDLTEAGGYKDSNRYWLDPTTPEGLEAVKAKREAMAKPSPDQIKAEADMRETEAKIQLDMYKAKSEIEATQREMEIKEKELALQERELALKEREQGLEEDKQDLEKDKFEWSKQVNISEVILEKESQRAAAIGDNKVLKKRGK